MRFSAPIRFPVAVIAIWIGARLWMVEGADPKLAIRTAQPIPPAMTEVRHRGNRAVRPELAATRTTLSVETGPSAMPSLNRLPPPVARRNVAVVDVAGAFVAGRASDPPIAPRPPRAQIFPPMLARVPVGEPSQTGWRPSFSGWLLVRTGGGSGSQALAPAGQLCASQAGVRMQLPVTRSPGAIAVNLRLSRALVSPQASEAGIGLSLRPLRALPIELIAERRVSLAHGGRDAWAIGVAGGVSRLPLPAGFMLDGYAQAGIVGAERRDLYVDGALELARPVVNAGRAELAIGGDLRAAAQPGLSRLDAGPLVTLRMPVADGNFRLTAGYRFRMAGNADPGSGFALTAGADF